MAFIVVVSLTDNNKYPTGIGNKLLFGIEFLTDVLFYSTDVAGRPPQFTSRVFEVSACRLCGYWRG